MSEELPVYEVTMKARIHSSSAGDAVREMTRYLGNHPQMKAHRVVCAYDVDAILRAEAGIKPRKK